MCELTGLRMNQEWYMGFYHTKDTKVALILSVPAKTVQKLLKRLTIKIVTPNSFIMLAQFLIDTQR
jgi:hypothetical protein